MSRGRRGMGRNVQSALGITDRKGPPEVKLGYCLCGADRAIGTDHEVPALVAAGMAIGRMVEFCPHCRKPSHIYPGPKFLTREDLEGATFYATPRPTKAQLARAAS